MQLGWFLVLLTPGLGIPWAATHTHNTQRYRPTQETLPTLSLYVKASGSPEFTRKSLVWPLCSKSCTTCAVSRNKDGKTSPLVQAPSKPLQAHQWQYIVHQCIFVLRLIGYFRTFWAHFAIRFANYRKEEKRIVQFWSFWDRFWHSWYQASWLNVVLGMWPVCSETQPQSSNTASVARSALVVRKITCRLFTHNFCTPHPKCNN